MKATEKNASGTSFHGTRILCTPNQLLDLVDRLGTDNYYVHNNGSDKVNFYFTFETDEGHVFTVYDWKHYRALDLNEPVRFHIGALNLFISEEGKQQLIEEIF